MHDIWEAAETGINRRTRTTKIINNQGVKELRLEEETPYPTFADIDQLVRRIKAQYAELDRIHEKIIHLIADSLILPEGPLGPSAPANKG
jgi:hypothetical protein